MARIRNIKPEFFLNAGIAKMEPLGRLFYMGLWCWADRGGIGKWIPNYLMVNIIPFDREVTEARINGWIEHLTKLGSITIFEFEGETYYYLRRFHLHQSFSSKETYKYPEVLRYIKKSDIGSDPISVQDQMDLGHRTKDVGRRIGVDDLEIRSSPKDLKSLLEVVGEKNKTSWAEIYPDAEFIRRELLKALLYYENNPRKKPKSKRGWTQAMNSWLARGWSWHVKTIPSEKKKSSSIGEVVRDL